jgi:hypothetical protein
MFDFCLVSIRPYLYSFSIILGSFLRKKDGVFVERAYTILSNKGSLFASLALVRKKFPERKTSKGKWGCINIKEKKLIYQFHQGPLINHKTSPL